MTELLDLPTEVRLSPDGSIQVVQLPEGWRVVARTTARWRVDTEWWRTPVVRDYHRCLTRSGECVELYHDGVDDTWHLARRYD